MEKITKPSLYEESNFLNRVYCSWVWPYYKLYNSRSSKIADGKSKKSDDNNVKSLSIELDDLHRCSKDDESARLYSKFEINYRDCCSRDHSQVINAQHLDNGASARLSNKSKQCNISNGNNSNLTHTSPPSPRKHSAIKELNSLLASSCKLFTSSFPKIHSPFLSAILLTFRTEILLNFLLIFAQDCLVKPVQPILIGLIIGYFNSLSASNSQSPEASLSQNQTILIAIGLCFSSLLVIALHHPSLTMGMRLSMRTKIIWSSMIYHKCLKVSSTTTSTRDDSGDNPEVSANLSQVINLLTNDVRRFDEFSLMSHYLVIVPIQTVLILIIAWHYIGPVCLATFGAFILLAYFLSYLGKWIAQLRTRSITFTERRLKILQEMFRYLRAIKIYTLESRFLARIYEARRIEIAHLQLPLTIRSATLSFSMVSGRVIMYFSFLLYLLLLDSSSEKFRPETMFVSVALFERLRYSLTWTLPQAIAGLHDFLSSCNRMEQFLQIPDKQTDLQAISTQTQRKKKSSNNKSGIWILNLYSRYSPKESSSKVIEDSSKNGNTKKAFQLQDINIKVESGQILSIIGPVGSGKTTLLLTILQELLVEKSTRFSITGSIGYVSQELYCLNDSIRENILFGTKFNQDRYHSVIEVCGLGADFASLPDADRTMVGESGVTLSGGQKARINLARALYSDRDIYLLDDPFSAVDVQLARHIYDRCIQSFLRDKCILIATHQLQFVPSSHRILLLDSGRPMAYGQFDQLMANNRHFADYFNHLSADIGQSSMPSKSLGPVIKKNVVPESNNRPKESVLNCDEDDDEGGGGDFEEDEMQRYNSQQFQKTNKNNRNLIAQYWNYFRLGSHGSGSFSLVILTAILPQIAVYYCDYWLTQWNQSGLSTSTFLLIYTAIVLSITLTSILRSYTFYRLCFNASERAHNRTICKISEAPVNRFDYVPIGKLLNYFTRDIGILDESLPSTLFELNLAFSQVISIVAVVLFLNPYMTTITGIYLVMLYHSRQYFANLSNIFRSFELQARNRIFAHLSSTMNGLVTIRAYSMERFYRDRFHQLQDSHTATNFLQFCSTRLFCTMIDLFALGYIAVVLAVMFYCSAAGSAGQSDNLGSLVGLCLGSIFNLIGIAQWAIKRTIDSDQWILSFMNLQLFDCLPKEQELETKEIAHDEKDDLNKKLELNGDCPANYEIDCTNLSVYYQQQHTPTRRKSTLKMSHNQQPMEFVLKNIDLRIRFGEKIGICGRSGAGKSTLANTLLRFTDYRGLIELNGAELHSFPLTELRRRISIIPQYPVIFSDTIRSNLDLFQRHTDRELWQVLERVQLRSMVESLENRLSQEISCDSSLLSIGQKQLICLARIMLQDSWLIILDEATANVDYHTDQLIQKTIRTVFRHCTVITIAHRLDSIIDCDRILVFNDGQLIEDDSPRRLLQNQTGHFSELVKQTGPAIAARLHSIVDNSN